MGITIKLFASFQELTGKNQVEVRSERVGDILEELVDRYPALEKEMFTSPSREELRPRVKVMINGRNIDFLDGTDTLVRETDRVAVFPPVGGG